MSKSQDPLIAGFATPPGGAIAILRISGGGALRALSRIFIGKRNPQESARALCYGHVMDEEGRIDEAMAVYFPAPHSYTAEDVVEIHLHGSPAVAERAMKAALSSGARIAAPGEFTRRAFLNGRIDLVQAEAVMALIRADSDRAAENALSHMEGVLSQRIRALQQDLEGAIAAIEAMLDYPEEVPEDTVGGVREIAVGVRASLEALLQGAQEGMRLRDGARVVLCGRPNAGKSTLMNALLGRERAIVTAQPGTTRDVLEETLHVEGMAIRLFDTAGLRAASDEAEAVGVARAREAIAQSDLALFLVDLSAPFTEEDRAIAASLQNKKTVVIGAKSDAEAVVSAEDARALLREAPYVEISARTGEGMEAVWQHLAALVPPREGVLITAARHRDALQRAHAHVQAALAAADNALPPDFLSIDLHQAWQALGELTGDTLDEAIIDRIFADFCLGK